MIAAHSAEICIRRYNGAPECDVIVVFRGPSALRSLQTKPAPAALLDSWKGIRSRALSA
jgi:hypothetical protein